MSLTVHVRHLLPKPDGIYLPGQPAYQTHFLVERDPAGWRDAFTGAPVRCSGCLLVHDCWDVVDRADVAPEDAAAYRAMAAAYDATTLATV